MDLHSLSRDTQDLNDNSEIKQTSCMVLVQLEIPSDASPDKRAQLQDQTVVVMQNRISNLNLSDASVKPIGHERVLTELPKVPYFETCEQLVSIRGLLEFKKVLKSSPVLGTLKPENISQAMLRGRECFIERLKDKCEEYLVETQPLLTGAALEPGKTRFKNRSQDSYEVCLRITETKYLAKEVNKVVALTLNGQVYGLFLITPEFFSNSSYEACIDGHFNQDEVQLLAAVLNAGALPIELRIVEKGTVSAHPNLVWIFVILIIGAVILYLVLKRKSGRSSLQTTS